MYIRVLVRYNTVRYDTTLYLRNQKCARALHCMHYLNGFLDFFLLLLMSAVLINDSQHLYPRPHPSRFKAQAIDLNKTPYESQPHCVSYLILFRLTRRLEEESCVSMFQSMPTYLYTITYYKQAHIISLLAIHKSRTSTLTTNDDDDERTRQAKFSNQ